MNFPHSGPILSERQRNSGKNQNTKKREFIDPCYQGIKPQEEIKYIDLINRMSHRQVKG